MDNPQESPTVLSLCTGYGGLEIGLERAIGELRVLAHVEIEAYAIANLVAKMEQGHLAPAPIWTNLKTLATEPFRDRVDILTGGYPCQPFSHAGQRKGSDDPRHLWPHIRRLVREIRPRLCFFENVEGHITLGLSSVISDMEEDGYRTTWGIFSASEVGAPHKRKRVFILAHSKNSKWWRGNAEDNQAIWSHCPGESSGASHWPAPPGQPQYEWEEPRVCMAKSKIRKNEQSNKQSQMPERDIQSTTKPSMGRTINGTPNRVDRLRLLGNGVVPQTAEKAFMTLAKELGLI